MTDFKENTYIVLLDKFKSKLLKEKLQMTAAYIWISAELLRNEYNADLGTSFSDECIVLILIFGSYL